MNFLPPTRQAVTHSHTHLNTESHALSRISATRFLQKIVPIWGLWTFPPKWDPTPVLGTPGARARGCGRAWVPHRDHARAPSHSARSPVPLVALPSPMPATNNANTIINTMHAPSPPPTRQDQVKQTPHSTYRKSPLYSCLNKHISVATSAAHYIESLPQ